LNCKFTETKVERSLLTKKFFQQRVQINPCDDQPLKTNCVAVSVSDERLHAALDVLSADLHLPVSPRRYCSA
jgi:hypothetical protein